MKEKPNFGSIKRDEDFEGDTPNLPIEEGHGKSPKQETREILIMVSLALPGALMIIGALKWFEIAGVPHFWGFLLLTVGAILLGAGGYYYYTTEYAESREAHPLLSFLAITLASIIAALLGSWLISGR